MAQNRNNRNPRGGGGGGGRPQGGVQQQQRQLPPIDRIRIVDTVIEPIDEDHVVLSALPQTANGERNVPRPVGLMIENEVINQITGRCVTNNRSGTGHVWARLDIRNYPDTIRVRVFIEGGTAMDTKTVRLREPAFDLVELGHLEVTAYPNPTVPGEVTVVAKVTDRESKPVRDLEVSFNWENGESSATASPRGEAVFELTGVPQDREIKGLVSTGNLREWVVLATAPPARATVPARRVAKIFATHADACASTHQVGVALRDGENKPIAGPFMVLRDGTATRQDVDDSGHTMVAVANVPDRGTASVTFDAMGTDKVTITLRGNGYVPTPATDVPKWLQPADLNCSYDPSDDTLQVVTCTIVNEARVGIPGVVRHTRKEVVTDYPADEHGVAVLRIPVTGTHETAYLNILGTGIDKSLTLRGPLASGHLVAPLSEAKTAAARPTTLLGKLGRLFREGVK